MRMKDLNSSEAVAARATQEDPIVMYLIVRESLGMSSGKIGAQCAHAAQMLLLQYVNEQAKWQAGFDLVYGLSQEEFDSVSEETKSRWSIFYKWLNNSFRKVVLRADDKEWMQIKLQLPIDNYQIVVDAGLTEIAAGSETVIGLWPMLKSERPKLIKKLQVLK